MEKTKVYLPRVELDRLLEAIGDAGALCCSLLAESREEALPQDSFLIGYLTGYCHGVDRSVYEVERLQGGEA